LLPQTLSPVWTFPTKSSAIAIINATVKHNMKYSRSKEIESIVRDLVDQGWLFWWGGKHGRLRHPRGFPVLTVPTSPGDRRALMNFLKDVRRADVECLLPGQQMKSAKDSANAAVK
jgi:hypothetical protein